MVSVIHSCERATKIPRTDSHKSKRKTADDSQRVEALRRSDAAKSSTGSLLSRLKTILKLDVQYISSPDFDASDARSLCVVDLNEYQPAARHRSPPADMPGYFTALYDIPLLGPTLEMQLFRRFNFTKFLVVRLREQLNPQRPAARRISEIEGLLRESQQLRDRIARANLRLVVANARLFADREHLFDDLVSDGNLALLQAIEKFDYTRGFRFSTYATHAIRRGYFRRMAKQQRERARLAFAVPEILQDVPQAACDTVADRGETVVFRKLLQRMPSCLNNREIAVLQARFSLESEDAPPTLQSLATTLGICKERVRQLQNRAIDKLRDLADEIRSEFDPDTVMMEEIELSGV